MFRAFFCLPQRFAPSSVCKPAFASLLARPHLLVILLVGSRKWAGIALTWPRKCNRPRENSDSFESGADWPADLLSHARLTSRTRGPVESDAFLGRDWPGLWLRVAAVAAAGRGAGRQARLQQHVPHHHGRCGRQSNIGGCAWRCDPYEAGVGGTQVAWASDCTQPARKTSSSCG
eukprot:6188497-Pleurochrysis_carterae.AAC.2